ncbi:hypothetical protein [Psychrobacter sp. CAL346-MNA-CIBAN-0220]|uniref:hypothetical protein n=1 Tax=Psychrobacter sp. CAL346-MNA-CIBAN-0220 TaxID=3140457 RepID=UPI00332ABAC8
MSYSSHRFNSKLFQLTSLTCALALAGCGGGDDTVDSIAPAPDLGAQPGSGNDGNDNGNNNDGTDQTPDIEPDFFLQTIAVTPNNIELSDEPTTFTVTIKAAEKASGGAIINKNISLKIENSENNGITIDGSSTLATDSDGYVTYNLQLNPNAVADKAQLLANGFNLTASAIKIDGTIITQMNKVPVFKKGSGDGTQVEVSKLNIQPLLNTSSVSNNILNAFGDTAVFSVIVKNDNGARAAGVTVGLGIASVKGVSITGGNSKQTDASGIANFNIEVDSKLIKSERNALIQQGVTYVINIQEKNGAAKDVSNKFIVAPPISDYKLDIESVTNKLSAYGDKQQLIITAKPTNDNVPTQINGAKVSVKLNNEIKGVVLSRESLILDNKGQATVDLIVAEKLNEETRAKLAKNGVSYTVMLSEPNRSVTTETYSSTAYIPKAQYQIQFSENNKEKISSFGSSVVISFRVNDESNGGAIAQQKVIASLPKVLSDAGLLTIEGNATQVSDDKGMVSYKVRVPEGLSTVQRENLEKEGGFILTAKVLEASGASSSISNKRVQVTAESETILTSKSIPSAVNVLKDQFTIQVAGKRLDGSAAAGKDVKLIINNVVGVSIQGNQQTTDASGNAIFTVNLSQDLTKAQRESLVKFGIPYTITLTDDDGIATNEYKASVIIPMAEYQLNFGSSSKAKLLSTGGMTTISFRVNDKNGGVIANQTVTASLPSSLIQRGLITLESAASQMTDSQGNVSYMVRIPTGLSATQRAELESAGRFLLNARLVESSGASIDTISNPISVTADPSISKTLLTSKSIPGVVNVLKDQFTIQVSAKRPNGSAAAGKAVELVINNVKGLSIEGSEKTTDSAGNAVFTINIDPSLTLPQRQSFVETGITYIATLTDEDGIATENYNVRAAVPSAEYKINFGSSSNAQLSSSGGSTIISFRVNDKDGGVIGNQKIMARLPRALIDSGLLTLDSAPTQTTDNKGAVSYTVRVPTGLSTAQKSALEKASGFLLNVNMVESSGASSTVDSAPISISEQVQRSSTVLVSENNPKVVNILKNQFTIQVSGKRKDGSAASDKVVKLTIDNSDDLTVQDNERTTDASGNAVFTVSVNTDLTQAEREALVKSGIIYTASLTDDDGVVTSKYNTSVVIPTAQYKINFGTSTKVQLSSSGGSAIISFRVNDKSGGVIANQKVTASLPINLIGQGLLTLESSAEQITNNQGIVSYTVRVPAGLSSKQKTGLEEADEFILTASAVEASGASSSISSAPIAIGSAIGQGDIKLTSTSIPKVVTVTDTQFTIQVSAKRPDSSAAVGNIVKLIIKETPETFGITIQGNEKITNAAGNAVFTINLSQDLTQDQRTALVASGISYTATITDNDGTEAKLADQKIDVMQPATSIKFASIITPSISELGGSGSVRVKLASKTDANKPIEGRSVVIKLEGIAETYGVTIIPSTQPTDFNGEAIFVINIPENLTAQQRTGLKRAGINYQLSYVEKDNTYNSKVQQVDISTPSVDLTVLNAPNFINNRPFYTLNGEGDTATIQAELSTQNTSFKITGQPIELAFVGVNKELAAFLNVNGKIGSATSIVSTNADGVVSFTVIVPNNLTQKEKNTLKNQKLTAQLTETLTGETQEIKFNIQSTKAAIDLIAITPKDLNLNGGETQIEVIAKDSKDNVIDGQKVFLALPAFIASQGVILASSGTQTTNGSGKAIFTIAVPNNLTDTQKAAIGNSFIVALSAADANGNISTKTSRVSTVTPSANGTQENLSMGANKVVNTKGDAFKVFVRVANNKGSIAEREVHLNVDEPIKTGVSVTNGNAITNSDGVATFNLKLEPGANVNDALLEAGIRLTATTITAESLEITQDYIVAVDTATIDSYQILVSSDKSTLNTGGDQTNATFRVTDSSGGVLTGVPVQLSINNLEASGAALTTPSMVTTDADGKIDVGVLLAANSINARLNHSVVINAKIVTPQYDANGNVSMQVREEKSLSLSAIGTEITLAGSEINLDDGETTTITTTLIDGAGRAIANARMELVDADGDIIATDANATTNADGEASFNIDESDLTFDGNGNLRVFARAFGENKLNTQRSSNTVNLVKVSQAGISFIDIKDVYDVNTPQTITVQIRRDTAAQATQLIGKQVEVQTSIGTFAGGNNNSSNVIVTKTISASDVTGNIITIPVILTSQLAGITALQATVLGESLPSGEPRYRATVDTRFRATTPAKMLFQAVRSVITPGSSTEIVATVKDENDVPVEGQTVVFSRAADSSAGRLSAATAITDSRGEARVVYQANASSPIGGVSINARLLNDNAEIGTKTTNITVSKEAVYTTLAFSNELTSDNIYYTLEGSISVMDGSGRAVSNQDISIKSYAIEYAQGNVCLLDSKVSYKTTDSLERYSEQLTIPMKSGWFNTEDPDYNYTLEKDDDLNGNNRLDAINPVSIIGSNAVSDDGYTFMTNDEGRADFSIRYPIRYANWVKVRFDASTLVNGSKNIQSLNFVLPYLEEDVEIINGTLKSPWANNASAFGAGGAQCIDSMSIHIDEPNKTTRVLLTPSQDFSVNINDDGDIFNPSTTSQGFNSFIVDFNQAFAVADNNKPLVKGAEIRVSNSGFSFKNVIRINTP